MQHRNIDRQLPMNDEIFLDHLGHFVPDPEAASRALIRAGFAPTPASVGVNPDASPTGTGNVTAMLGRGYIEVLFKTANTALGREFGLTETQTEAAVTALLPAISTGLKQSTATVDGLDRKSVV